MRCPSGDGLDEALGMGDEMYTRPSGGGGTAAPQHVLISTYLSGLPELCKSCIDPHYVDIAALSGQRQIRTHPILSDLFIALAKLSLLPELCRWQQCLCQLVQSKGVELEESRHGRTVNRGQTFDVPSPKLTEAFLSLTRIQAMPFQRPPLSPIGI
jgi:hypothetical protein